MNIATKYRLKIGTSDFSKLVTESDLFVDKTLLINDIIKDTNEVLLITRPRRWGKTLNMSMLQYFFSPNIKPDGSVDNVLRDQKLQVLSGLNIHAHPDIIDKYFGKYPTIFISFNDVNATTYEEMEEFVCEVIYHLYKTHEYLTYSDKLSKSDMSDLSMYLTRGQMTKPMMINGIKSLSEMLYKHFGQKVIILIDEYDKPLNDWYVYRLSCNEPVSENNQYIQKVLKLFSSIFGSSLKNNIFLEKGVVTGILRIAKASLFSGVNNFKERSILDKEFAEYFGFTEDEVNMLLHNSGIEANKALAQEVKDWYNGYQIGDYTIYNPWSIMRMIDERGNLEAYWMGTGDPSLIQSALVLDKFQEEVQSLIEGRRINMTADPQMIFTDITSSPNALYNLLLFAGYLTACNVETNENASYDCEVRIPNREISGIFTNSIQRWVSKKFGVEIDIYKQFIDNLLQGKVAIFVEQLKNYLEFSASFYSTGSKNAEVFYNGFMLGLIATISNKYFVETEKESGAGRVDLMLIPKANARHRNAIVIEFKSSHKEDDLLKAASGALEQIKDKNYVSKIRSHDNVKNIISVGLAFCGKDVEVAFEDLTLEL